MTTPKPEIPETILAECPRCNASNTIRYGTRNGNQIWYCRPCRKQWTDNGAKPGRRVPPEQVAAAIGMFYRGLSTEDVRQTFSHVYDFEPSTASVYEWVRDYSNLAERELRDCPPTKLGGRWVADEMVVKAGGRNLWVWTMMDSKTRFILGSHVSLSRNAGDATALFKDAKRNAGGQIPRVIVTDGLASYPQARDKVFGLRTKHIVTGSVADDENNNLIERLNGTVRERTKVMRGMKSRKTAEELLEGWTTHYNYFRPHESLGGKTPSEAAATGCKLKSWEDVARLDVRPISRFRSRKERMAAASRLERRTVTLKREIGRTREQAEFVGQERTRITRRRRNVFEGGPPKPRIRRKPNVFRRSQVRLVK